MAGEEPRPGNFDRAWNDPPLFSYDATSAKSGEATHAKLGLNKRVGFPGAGAPAMPPPPKSGDLGAKAQLDAPALHDAGAKSTGAALPPPPPMAMKAPPPKASNAEINDEPQAGKAEPSEEIGLDSTLEQLTAALEASTLDDRKLKDIKKRIGTMETKWRSGALNDKVHAGVASIASSLAAGDAEKAEKTQLSLVVDWPSLCGTWMVGLKHLIVNAKEAQKEEEKVNETD